MPEREAKTVLRGAMLSPIEAKQVDRQIRQAGQDKSKWIRSRLLEPPRSSQENSPEAAILHLAGASLLDSDNRVVANGSAILFRNAGVGDFYPEKHSQTSGNTLPRLATTLRASDGRLYTLKPDKTMCEGTNKPPHFHFDFED